MRRTIWYIFHISNEDIGKLQRKIIRFAFLKLPQSDRSSLPLNTYTRTTPDNSDNSEHHRTVPDNSRWFRTILDDSNGSGRFRAFPTIPTIPMMPDDSEHLRTISDGYDDSYDFGRYRTIPTFLDDSRRFRRFPLIPDDSDDSGDSERFQAIPTIPNDSRRFRRLRTIPTITNDSRRFRMVPACQVKATIRNRFWNLLKPVGSKFHLFFFVNFTQLYKERVQERNGI